MTVGKFELKIEGDQLVSVQQVVDALQQVSEALLRSGLVDSQDGLNTGDVCIKDQRAGRWLLKLHGPRLASLRDAIKPISYSPLQYSQPPLRVDEPPHQNMPRTFPQERKVITPEEEPCTDCPNPSCFNFELCSKKLQP